MGILILIILQSIVFGLYTAYRLYQAFFTKYKKLPVIISLLLIFSSFLIVRILVKYCHINVPHNIVFATHIILAVTNYLFMYLIITDIVRLIFKIIHKPFITHKLQLIIVLSATFITVLYGYINSHDTKTAEYNITLNKHLNGELKIAAVSDLHIGADMSPARLEKEVNNINKYHPDIIFIAGDIIDNNINDFTYAHIDALKKLYAPLGVYAVIGNHDYYSADAATLKSLIEKTNIKVLLDNVTYIQEKGIYIIGRDSLRHTNDNGSKRQNIVSLYNNIEDKSKPVIILDHVPKGLDDGRKINADIQISGHTHDGQTFPLNLIIKILTFLPHGMINDNGFHYFVSSGLGLWGPPVRVGTDSEILIINVKGKDL